MTADVHVHSIFSTDSEAPMEKQADRAIELGIPVLCFTDHIDYDYPVKDLTFDFDIDEYMNKVDDLKKQYAGRLEIYAGVELGLQEHLAKRYHDLLKNYPFDFAIGSQHLVDNMDPYYPETFEGRSDGEVFRHYFEDTLRDVRAFHEFDSMGHLDYVVRYGRYKAKEYSYRTYSDVIDEILKLLVKYNIAIELNTCGLRKRLGFPNPHPDILKRYRELGGTLVTIGSDAHHPAHLGYQFEEAREILKHCGFSHYAYYVKRQPRFVKL